MRTRPLLLSIALLAPLAARQAHAMGVYASYELVAWSDDGASALLVYSSSSSGTAGEAHTYVLVGAGDKKALEFQLTNTRDPDTAHEQITPAQCQKTADNLEHALAAHRFKGIALDRKHCGSAKRDVVTIDAATTRAAELSWVATPGARHPTSREDAAWKLAKVAHPEGGVDVAATTGTLTLVMWGESGDGGAPKHGVVYAGTKRLFEL